VGIHDSVGGLWFDVICDEVAPCVAAADCGCIFLIVLKTGVNSCPDPVRGGGVRPIERGRGVEQGCLVMRP
jgi:hypothetical protein